MAPIFTTLRRVRRAAFKVQLTLKLVMDVLLATTLKNT